MPRKPGRAMNFVFPFMTFHVPSGVVVDLDHLFVVASQIRRVDSLKTAPDAGVPSFVGVNQPVPLGLIRMRWSTTFACALSGKARGLTAEAMIGAEVVDVVDVVGSGDVVDGGAAVVVVVVAATEVVVA